MLNRTKLLISILISSLVFIAGIILLVVFVTYNPEIVDPGKDPEPTPVHVVDTIDFTTYNSQNKKFFVTEVTELLSLNKNLYDGLTEDNKWVKNFVDDTLKNIPDAFRKAKVDLQTYKNVNKFIVDFQDEIEGIAFDFTELMSNTSGGVFNIIEILSKTENLNAILKIIDEFYSTGITNNQLANVIYYFVDLELTTLANYKFELHSSLDLEPLEEIEALVIFIESFVIDGIDLVHEYFLEIPQDQFVTLVEEFLDSMLFFLDFYKSYNVYKIVEVFELIKSGQVKAEELSLLVTDMRNSLLERVDPETGKVFNMSRSSYSTIYSIATKIPFINKLLTQWTGFPDTTEAVANIITSVKNSEDFLNRAFQGIINITEKINNNKTLIIVNEQGQITAQKSMAQAIIDNIQEIYTDKGIVANSDTIIIISKLLSGYFDTNALNPTYLNGYLTANNKMLESVFNMFALEGNESGEYATLEAFKGTLMSLSKLIIEFSKHDIGSNVQVLIDASPSYVIVENIVNNIFEAIFNRNFEQLNEILVAIVIIQLMPAAAYVLITMPVILPLSVAFIGAASIVSYVSMASVISAFNSVSLKNGFVFDADRFMAGLLAGKSMDDAIKDSTLPENYDAVRLAFAGVEIPALVAFYAVQGVFVGGEFLIERLGIAGAYLVNILKWEKIS